MNQFSDYIIRKLRHLMIASALAVPLLYFQVFTGEKRLNCNPPPVAPRVNADGTIDHVLISKCEGWKGSYVVVRFAADHKTNVSEKMDPTEVGGFGGPTVTLSSSTNQYVAAYYDMSNGWQPVTVNSYENIDINVTAEIMFTRLDHNYTRVKLEENIKNAVVACELPVTHSNGIVEYRLKKGRTPDEYPNCFGTFTNPESARAYVSMNPTAAFDCSSPPGGDYTGACRGSVDTPEQIDAEVIFRNTEEPSPEQITLLIPRVMERVKAAFLAYGELQPDEEFSFEKLQEIP